MEINKNEILKRFISHDVNDVPTKEQLLNLLKEYKGILSIKMFDYLNSLINLEFSIIKNNISENDRKMLSELEIYKEVAKFNIYNRAYNICKEKNLPLKFFDNETGKNGLSVSVMINKHDISLFDFDYTEKINRFTEHVPEGYKTMEIGAISLYRTIEDKELKEEELNRIINELDILYAEKNPYGIDPEYIGGRGSNWHFQHSKKIKEYEEKFKYLDEKKDLTDEEKKEIEITNCVYDLFLEDYGLTNDDFENNEEDFIGDFSICYEDKSLLNKKLIKKMPNLEIRNNVKYI